MVLGAGRGLRMRPLSMVVPKPALPLPDGPVIASAIRLAAAAGARNIAVNTWHLADRMAAAVAEVDLPGVTIVLSREDSLMGTAGGLALARDRGLLGDSGPILVVNGDGALGLDLSPLLDDHLRRADLVTLALLPHLDPRRWSQVELDAKGHVAAILPAGQPGPDRVPYLYPGVMVVSRPALESLPSTPGEIPGELWQPARVAGGLGGTVVAGHWREVGTPAEYLDLVVTRLAGASLIHPTAEVAASAGLDEALIGAGASVAADATVRRSAVVGGAAVAAGSTVVDSVLIGEARTGDAEFVCNQYRIGALSTS